MTDSAKKTLTVVLSVVALVALIGYVYWVQTSEKDDAVVPSPTPDAVMTPLPDNGETSVPVPTTAPEAAEDEALMQNQTWTWVSTMMNDGTEVTPNTPGVFTLDFEPDGTLGVGTDCNSMSSSYYLPAVSQIAITPMASTLMFCENSQEAEFARMIQDSTGYMFDENGNLVLLLKFDSGSVSFE